MNQTDLAKQLLALTTVSQVVSLIDALESEGYTWLPVGGKPNNTGQINQGSDPAESLAERITNAIDAILEREWMEHHQAEPQPTSPREAVEKWFHIKDGRISTIANKEERRRLAQRIGVTLYESGVERSPTVVIRDAGIGQHPSKFQSTLLSLSEENKIDKHFLMGAYGQGGATVYAFCQYTVILSRRAPSLLPKGSEDQVGWTIVRYNPLDLDHKNGTYQYMVTSTKEIPWLLLRSFPEQFNPGTQIRMVQYQLPKHFTIFTAVSSSLWALTNMVLPDPVLPFLIGDERVHQYERLKKLSAIQRTRVVLGSINRLRQKVEGKSAVDAEESDRSVDVLHYQECKVNLGVHGEPVIRYWILGPQEGSKSAPVDAFADSQSAIVVTLNGQRQGKYDRNYFRNTLGLAILRDYMLIQIDCDKLSKAGKKELFSSDRSRMRDVELLDALLGETKAVILKDPYVIEIARQLQEAALKSASSARNLRLSRQLEQLIAQWEVGDRSKVLTEVGRQMLYDPDGKLTLQRLHRKQEVEADEDDEKEPPPPKPPSVWLGKYIPTKFDFVIKKEPMRIPIARRARKGNGHDKELWTRPFTIWFETDAKDDCLTRDTDRGQLTWDALPASLLVERTRSRMKAGKVFIRVVPTEAAKPDTELDVSATLSFPGSPPLTASRHAILQMPHPGKRKPVQVEGEPRYKIVPVLREGDHWETDAEEEDKKQRINLPSWTLDTVAEVQPGDQGITILVNMSNMLYVSAIKDKVLTPETISRYSDKYKVAIAFHSYLQYRAEKALADASKPTPSDEVHNQELERTVRTVIFTTFVAPEAEVLAAEPGP